MIECRWPAGVRACAAVCTLLAAAAAAQQTDPGDTAEAAPGGAAAAETAAVEAAPSESAATESAANAAAADAAAPTVESPDSVESTAAVESAERAADAPLGELLTNGAEALAERPVPVTRFEIEIEIRDLIDAGDYAAAAALTARLDELSAEEFGPDSLAYADALLLGAEALKLDRNFEAAEENALRAVEIYRQQEGTFAEAMIDPYVALGDVYRAADDYLNAMPAYEEARTISRRVNGLHNPGQIEILERMSATAEELGEISDARDYQRDALALVERRNEPHSPEVVAAVVRYGEWLRAHSMFTTEQELYSRTERAVAEQYGDDSRELVPLLRARANSFRAGALNHPLGIGSLRQAREILMADPDPLMIAEVERDIGDWQAAFNPLGSDGVAYMNSWRALGEVENGEELREEWFGELPTRFVLLAARSQRGFSTAADAAVGQLIIRFTVLPSGLTSEVDVTDANPPGIAEEAFLRQFRASRFRPMIRDGRLVSARRGFSAEFRYDPKRYD